jgi:hypothetical protein
MKLNFSPVLILFFFLSLDATATGDFLCIGARPLSMGRTSVALPDFWSLGNNQAGVAFLKGAMSGISAETCFLPADVTVTSIGAFFETRPAHFGVILTRFGNPLYSEIKTGISVARKFGKYFSAGLQADYLRIQQPEGYPTVNLITCEAGLMFRTGKNWSFGFHILNPIPQKMSGNGPDRLPTIFRFGASYLIADKINLAAECSKNPDNPPQICAGLEYWFVPGICGRTGVTFNPTMVSAGFGFRWKSWVVDIGSSYHLVLGYSPMLSISYKIKG